MKQILLVEDDSIIAYGLIYVLEQEGYTVVHKAQVREAVVTIMNNKFDLAIIDMQLPDGTGFDIREKLQGSETAVIFLTVDDDEVSIVSAFESGADDYITKPFRVRELVARVKRSLNAHSIAETSDCLSIGKVIVDTSAGKAYIGKTFLELTALEYRLLITFALNKGQILTRTQILESTWDSVGNFVEDNTLTVYVKRLREKLKGAVNIETVRGIGYRADS